MSKEVIKEVSNKKEKRNKTQKYSYINAIDDLLERYFEVYQKLAEHKEGCISGDIYDKINKLLVEDYNNSINNLEFLSKKSMKYLKKKDKYECRKIFWYKFSRFFGKKKNKEIEELIVKREKYKLEMAKLFEDLISANIRNKVEEFPQLENLSQNDEPDFVDDVKDLFAGPDEKRALHGEVVDSEKLSLSEKQTLGYTEENYPES